MFLVVLLSLFLLLPCLVAVGAPLKWLPILNTRKKAFIGTGIIGLVFAVSLGVLLGASGADVPTRKIEAEQNAVERASASVESAQYIPETKALIIKAYVPAGATEAGYFDKIVVLMHDVARGLNDMPETTEAEKVMVNVFAQLADGQREQVVHLTYSAEVLRKSLPDSGALILNGARDTTVRAMLRPERDAWCVENSRLAPNFCEK